MDQLCKKGHTIFQDKCKACTELQTEWYSTLKATGFIDAERDITNSSRSTTTLGCLVDTQNALKFEAKQSFYLWAQRQAEEAKFKSRVDAKIWSQYSSGVTFRSMESTIGLDHTWIYRKVKKIENYLKEQGRSIVASLSYEAAVY